MKVAVYNRWWPTAGGGEKYTAAFAEALSAEHDVHLLGYDEVDLEDLGERLDVDLSRTTLRVLLEQGSGTLARATEGYDLLVNCSYMSSESSGARKGIYVTHFPTPFDLHLSRFDRAVQRALGPLVRNGKAEVSWGTGFFPSEKSRFRRYIWTAGEATLYVHADAGVRIPVELVFGKGRPPGAPAGEVTVEVGGRVTATRQTGPPAPRPVSFAVLGRGRHDPVAITIRSDTFDPGAVLGSEDHRPLGVQLADVRIGSRPINQLGRLFPASVAAPITLDFLDTYDALVSNSAFTREWVSRLWSRDSAVLHPPVKPVIADGTSAALRDKGNVMLTVGRFFDNTAGHSKKQLELVQAFRALVEAGLQGWEYHLVGGCKPSETAYLDAVRAAAEGLPVHFHIDASGAELRSLYRRASIYWHATGLGDDAERNPHRLEHFGITTVEAMSAGAVPVVIGVAGPAEVVENGVSGYHFQSVAQLLDRTRALAHDPDLRHTMAVAAIARAEEFGPAAFHDRLVSLVESL